MIELIPHAVATTKVAISIDSKLLERLDRLVAQKRFTSRSRAIQTAVESALARFDRTRLERESAKLDRAAEQRLAEEGASRDLEGWPEY